MKFAELVERQIRKAQAEGQFDKLKGAGVEQYEKEGAVAIVYPSQYADGTLQPFSK